MRRWHDEHGSVAVETAVIAPVLLVLMLLVVYAGRAAQTDADVQTAAARAARAASLVGDADAAVQAATATAAANLSTAGIVCQDTDIVVDVDDFRAGGTVTTRVACEVSNADIVLLAVPGSRWSIGGSTHVVDQHRGGG